MFNKTLNMISSYRVVLGDLVKKGWEKASNYCGTWLGSRNRIIKIYGAALQSSSPQIVQLVQVIPKLSFLTGTVLLLSSLLFQFRPDFSSVLITCSPQQEKFDLLLW
jgi:hypothetical protein